MRRVVRFIRKAVLWTLFITAVVVAVGMVVLYQRIDTEVERYVQAELKATFPNARVEIAGSRLLMGKGIMVYGFALYDPRDDSKPVLSIEEIFIDCPAEITQFLRGDVEIRKISVRRPQLSLTRGTDGSLEELPVLTARQKDPAQRCCVEISEGSLIYVDEQSDRDRELKIDAIAMEIRPANSTNSVPSSTVAPTASDANPDAEFQADGNEGDGNPDEEAFPEGTWTFVCSAKSAFMQELHLQGHFNPITFDWACTGNVRQFEWFSELPGYLPIGIDEDKHQEFQHVLDTFAGRADIELNVVRDPKARWGVRFEVDGKLSHGHVAFARLRRVFTELSGSFRITDQMVEIRDLTASNGAARIGINYRQHGLSPIESGMIRTSIRELQVDNELVAHIRPFFSENLSHLISRFEVDGRADIDSTLVWNGKAWQPQQILLQGRRCSFNYLDFPYAVGNLEGTITFRSPPGETPTFAFRFITPKEETPALQIEGDYRDLLRDPVGEVLITGEGIPINAKLMQMLPAKHREIVESLRPKGSVNAVFRLTAPPNDAPLEKQLSISLDNCEIEYEKFRYPMREVYGTIEMADDHWTFKDIIGQNEGARITCRGHLVPADQAVLPEKNTASLSTAAPAPTVFPAPAVAFHQPAAILPVSHRAAVSESPESTVPAATMVPATSMVPITPMVPVTHPASPRPFAPLSVEQGGIPPVGPPSILFPGTERPGIAATRSMVTSPESAAKDEPEYRFMLWVDVVGLPVDGAIRQALPDPNHREILHSLGAKGKVDLKAWINYIPSLGRPMVVFDADPCPGMTLNPKLFPYRIDYEKGTISFSDDGTVRVRDFQGRNKDTVFHSSFYVNFARDGSWLVRLSPMKIDQLSPNRELQNALPPALQTLFEQIQLKGTFNLDGFVEFSKGPQPQAPMKTTWGLGVVLCRNSAVLGLPVENIFGKIYLTGRNESTDLKVSGHLDLNSITINGHTLSDMTGPFCYDSWSNTVHLGTTRTLPVFLPLENPTGNPAPPLSQGASVYRGQIAEAPSAIPLLPLPVPATDAPANAATNFGANIVPGPETSPSPVPQVSAPQADSPILQPFPVPTLRYGVALPQRDPRSSLLSPLDALTVLPPLPMKAVVPEPRAITARIYDGSVALAGEVLLGRTLSYSLSLGADKLELSRLVAETEPRAGTVSGKVYCRAKIRGEGQKLETLDGAGEVKLRDAYLYETPLMMKVLQTVSIGEPEKSAFDEANIGFRLQGKRAILEPVDFSGAMLTLKGRQGELWLDTQTVRMQLEARLGNKRAQIPLISDVIGGVGAQVMVLQIDGPISGPPEVTQVFVPSLHHALRNAQGDNFTEEDAVPVPQTPSSKTGLERLRFWE